MVLVLPAEAPYAICGRVEKNGGKHILYALADSCLGLGLGKSVWLAGEMLVVFSPYHAELLWEEGWTKRDVQNYLFETRPLREELSSPAIRAPPPGRSGSMRTTRSRLGRSWTIRSSSSMATPGGNVTRSLGRPGLARALSVLLDLQTPRAGRHRRPLAGSRTTDLYPARLARPLPRRVTILLSRAMRTAVCRRGGAGLHFSPPRTRAVALTRRLSSRRASPERPRLRPEPLRGRPSLCGWALV